MKLVSKVINPVTHFWVEDYNELEKEFFISLGFKEVQSNMPKSFGGKPTLQFKGSGMFGGMSKDEYSDIVWAMLDKFKGEELKVHEMNPYD
jgi:hypothetical protein